MPHADAFAAVIYQYRRYRTLKGDLSMVRERKDFYQLKKAAGGDPAPTPDDVPTADAPVADEPVVDATGKRKKKKAKRARSAAETEVDVGEDSGAPDAGDAQVESAAAAQPRTAREEVHVYLVLVCTACNSPVLIFA